MEYTCVNCKHVNSKECTCYTCVNLDECEPIWCVYHEFTCTNCSGISYCPKKMGYLTFRRFIITACCAILLICLGILYGGLT